MQGRRAGSLREEDPSVVTGCVRCGGSRWQSSSVNLSDIMHLRCDVRCCTQSAVRVSSSRDLHFREIFRRLQRWFRGTEKNLEQCGVSETSPTRTDGRHNEWNRINSCICCDWSPRAVKAVMPRLWQLRLADKNRFFHFKRSEQSAIRRDIDHVRETLQKPAWPPTEMGLGMRCFGERTHLQTR